MRRSKSTLMVAACAVALGVTAGACGSSGSKTSTGNAPGTPASSTAPGSSPASTAPQSGGAGF